MPTLCPSLTYRYLLTISGEEGEHRTSEAHNQTVQPFYRRGGRQVEKQPATKDQQGIGNQLLGYTYGVPNSSLRST